MTDPDPTDPPLQVLGPDLPRGRRTTILTNQRLEEIKANSPNWCVINTYGSINGASTASARYSNKYPDLHWDSRTIEGVPTVSAKHDPSTKPVIRPKH